MIDIHSHILPGIDDGSESMETSIEMLLTAAQSGVKSIVATPHCNIPDEFGNYASRQLDSLFGELTGEAERAGIPIRIVRGMEIFATDDLPELLRDGRVWTINDWWRKLKLAEAEAKREKLGCWAFSVGGTPGRTRLDDQRHELFPYRVRF